MAIDTMTIGSNIMCQLDVLSGFRQTLERLETFIVNSLSRRGRKDLVNILLKTSQVPFRAQYFPHCWQGTGVAIEVEFGIVC